MVKRICIICGKEYSAYEEPNKSRGSRVVNSKRKYNSITCSKECAREHQRSRQLKELKDKNEI